MCVELKNGNLLIQYFYSIDHNIGYTQYAIRYSTVLCFVIKLMKIHAHARVVFIDFFRLRRKFKHI